MAMVKVETSIMGTEVKLSKCKLWLHQNDDVLCTRISRLQPNPRRFNQSGTTEHTCVIFLLLQCLALTLNPIALTHDWTCLGHMWFLSCSFIVLGCPVFGPTCLFHVHSWCVPGYIMCMISCFHVRQSIPTCVWGYIPIWEHIFNTDTLRSHEVVEVDIKLLLRSHEFRAANGTHTRTNNHFYHMEWKPCYLNSNVRSKCSRSRNHAAKRTNETKKKTETEYVEETV